MGFFKSIRHSLYKQNILGLCALTIFCLSNTYVLAESIDRYNNLVDSAHIFQAKGYKHRALPLLFEARLLANELSIDKQISSSLDLGQLYFEVGDYVLSLSQLESIAALSNDPEILAKSLNTQANIHSILNNPKIASDTYERAKKTAKDLPRLKLTIMLNQLRHQLDHKIKRDIVSLQNEILILEKTQSDVLSNQLISMAHLIYRASTESKGTKNIRSSQNIALVLLEKAEKLAKGQNNKLIESYALGYQGEIYGNTGRSEQAFSKLRNALFLANSSNAFESAYLWQWQIAKLNKIEGNTELAIKGYENAITTLEYVRQDLVDGSPYTFSQKVQPLFTELSDLLLISALASNGEQKQSHLKSVQKILEQAKSAELEDYFQNECVIPDQSIDLNKVESQTAVIYPVILKNRLEMLVNIDATIYQFVSKISASELNEITNEFRYQLQEDLGDEEYLELSQELYEVLFSQAESLLQKHEIKTLLVIPDGALRTIPMSAIYDGEQYMIEKYAVATTPGISLTLPKPFSVQEAKLFAGGISEAVQGFVGLPGVPGELANLKDNYGASILQNNKFLGRSLKDQLSSADYSIVHIATHGHFDRNPKKSFLLTYDDKLTMDALEDSISGRGDKVLELLVLSACETAAGDSRAALGLAGVALKAGARSALATLWQISDAATVRIITDFYKNTSQDEISKAEALQLAQINLLNQAEFSHPSDWAPFLLIGNWL